MCCLQSGSARCDSSWSNYGIWIIVSAQFDWNEKRNVCEIIFTCPIQLNKNVFRSGGLEVRRRRPMTIWGLLNERVEVISHAIFSYPFFFSNLVITKKTKDFWRSQTATGEEEGMCYKQNVNHNGSISRYITHSSGRPGRHNLCIVFYMSTFTLLHHTGPEGASFPFAFFYFHWDRRHKVVCYR